MACLIRGATRFTLSNGRVFSKILKNHSACTQHAANISSKAFRELNGIQRPPPYDYKNKSFTLFDSWFDRTIKRIDENSKVNSIIKTV